MLRERDLDDLISLSVMFLKFRGARMNWTALSDGYGGVQDLSVQPCLAPVTTQLARFGIGSVRLTHASAMGLSHAAD